MLRRVLWLLFGLMSCAPAFATSYLLTLTVNSTKYSSLDAMVAGAESYCQTYNTASWGCTASTTFPKSAYNCTYSYASTSAPSYPSTSTLVLNYSCIHIPGGGGSGDYSGTSSLTFSGTADTSAAASCSASQGGYLYPFVLGGFDTQAAAQAGIATGTTYCYQGCLVSIADMNTTPVLQGESDKWWDAVGATVTGQQCGQSASTIATTALPSSSVSVRSWHPRLCERQS